MHLKSLVLKGFKSFADRSVLQMEPGITAIVGPNGSGKSNISDAVLWVLGERNARNLRGQAMEDIIFSGSAARKAVSVAEVELVLDNSDATLPVDFDEVSIARRMYRSGESEYLINGVVSRRMDVLDILHDSGLGTSTHSIISQGSLDSILQSRPAERRALIEEAAGVLKHKQRKEKSARKLERMDNHLMRVRDVAAEVERQLGPLERKAKRAEAYKTASADLARVRLDLAVDDLRRLQASWDEVCRREADLAERMDTCREGIQAAEAKAADLQELIRRSSEDAGTLSRHQRRVESITERLDSTAMIARERKRTAQGYVNDIRATMEGSAQRRSAAEADLEAACEQLANIAESARRAEAQVEDLRCRQNEVRKERRAAEQAAEEAAREYRSLEVRQEEARRKRAELQEDLSAGVAHGRLIDARKAELSSELERMQQDHDCCANAAREARDLLKQFQQEDREAQTDAGRCLEQRDAARLDKDRAQDALRSMESEIKAIDQAKRARRADVPAFQWVLDNKDKFDSALAPVVQALKAPMGMERLVERLLGDDLSALTVGDPDRAQALAKALQENALQGDITVMFAADSAAYSGPDARRCVFGHALLDDLSYPSSWKRVMEALLGDVVVCGDAEEAFAAHATDSTGYRFASADGVVIWPQGKASVFGAPADQGEGLLALERRLDGLRHGRDDAERILADAEKAVHAAEELYRDAQARSLKASQKLAEQRGICEAADAEERRTADRLASMAREAQDIDKQREQARASLEAMRPNVEQAEALIAELEAACAQQKAARDEALEKAEPLRVESARLEGLLSEARLEAATLEERRSYAQRLMEARRTDIARIDADAEEARRTLAAKAVAVQRADPVIRILHTLAESLIRRERVLAEAIERSEHDSHDVTAQAQRAREEARRARIGLDDINEQMSQVRVEKGRLEIQVETAVNTVTQDCAMPLEIAQALPMLEDRMAAEDEALRLERRIKNMGTINPDAAEEYAVLKERFDFLAGQLADMEAARRSLARIERVIDARMKDDFSNTFAQVKDNFSEIFQVLFPGGDATLELEDPDDIENTGVEVIAQPRGKRIRKMMLMSGGEKSLTALALLFAVYRIRSTPFYILDEVEAALDDTNLRRLVSYIDKLRDTTQLIMITHQRRTMEMADVLFGVSMQSDGVTKVISQKLERALEQAE